MNFRTRFHDRETVSQPSCRFKKFIDEFRLDTIRGWEHAWVAGGNVTRGKIRRRKKLEE